MKHLIQVTNLSKQYQNGGQEKVAALKDLSFTVEAGESVAIVGHSGSGKSTLLHVLGGLDTPTQGEIVINGQHIHRLNDTELSQFRNKTIGFVFQFFNLIDYLTAAENVMLPQLVAGKSSTDALDRAQELLKQVGLAGKEHKLPRQLSGGEMQRVAIARALANEPALILADEPTGNLDKANADKVMAIFDEVVKQGVTLLTITHDEKLSKQFGRVMHLDDGKLVKQK